MNLKRSSKISFTPTPMLMRKAFLTTFTSLALTVLLATSVPAMLIVDTGAPTALGPALISNQWHYGQFTTTQDYCITAIFGFISRSRHVVGFSSNVDSVHG